MKLEIELPYPPTVNTYWRNVNGRTLISKKGRKYKQDVGMLLIGEPKYDDKKSLSIQVFAYPPDRRKRDMDNILKSLLDSLAPIIGDDSQFNFISVAKMDVVKGGKVEIIIEYSQDQWWLSRIVMNMARKFNNMIEDRHFKDFEFKEG